MTTDDKIVPHFETAPPDVPIVPKKVIASGRWVMLLWALVAGLLATVSLMLVAFVFQATRRPFVDVATVGRYTIEDACPENQYTVSITVSVHRAPVFVTTIHTWWDVDNNRTAISDHDPAYIGYPEIADIQRSLVITIPDLPAGHYRYTMTTVAVGSIPSPLVVPVTVLSCGR